MKQESDGIEKRTQLRAEAEAMVGNLSPDEKTAKPAEILLHELLVHKVELEMQNEELRRAYNALEQARDRYIDLYEFAPAGYITVNREGLISEINLTGSTLLGVDRNKLLKRRFSTFVAPQNKDLWHRLFMDMMQHPTDQKQEFCLEMTRADGDSFYAHFDCLRREALDMPPMLRVVLTDISKLKLAMQE